jgi:HAD superfamily phosphatase (TIGR01668 family)
MERLERTRTVRARSFSFLRGKQQMRLTLVPDSIFRRIECITPDFLQQRGITALVLDVDNTLTGDGSQQLDASVQQWIGRMHDAEISLTIVSNNTAKRVRPFAERIGLGWVPLACKPLSVGLWVARRRLGVPRSRMAMVGDQIFTDCLAANLFGIPCLLTLPRGDDRNRGVKFKRRYEKKYLEEYYRNGGTLYE